MSTGGPTLTTYTPPEGLRAIISGAGGVREHLAETLRAHGVRRPMILCGRNVGATPLVQVVAAAAGMECAVFTGSQEHTPISAVDSGRDAARDCRADALIALGGSSAIDCAKAVAVLLRRNLASASELEPVGFIRAAEGPGRNPDPMPLICIPTTLSAAEFYPFFGMRDTGQRRKQPYMEEGLVNRTLFFDGEIAASTPGRLWAETGVKSMDDALYRYCSEPSDEPASDAVLVCGIRGLFEGLAAGIDGDPAARQDNFLHL
jgi:alcohol dehydrogenase